MSELLVYHEQLSSQLKVHSGLISIFLLSFTSYELCLPYVTCSFPKLHVNVNAILSAWNVLFIFLFLLGKLLLLLRTQFKCLLQRDFHSYSRYSSRNNFFSPVQFPLWCYYPNHVMYWLFMIIYLYLFLLDEEFESHCVILIFESLTSIIILGI